MMKVINVQMTMNVRVVLVAEKVLAKDYRDSTRIVNRMKIVRMASHALEDRYMVQYVSKLLK